MVLRQLKQKSRQREVRQRFFDSRIISAHKKQVLAANRQRNEAFIRITKRKNNDEYETKTLSEKYIHE